MQEDVLANSFNILRAFVHLYGRDAQLKLVCPWVLCLCTQMHPCTVLLNGAHG